MYHLNTASIDITCNERIDRKLEMKFYALTKGGRKLHNIIKHVVWANQTTKAFV